MYCSKCGSSIPDDSNFCSFCGKPVIDTKSSSNNTVPITSSNNNNSTKEKVLSKEGLLYISGRRNRKPYIWTNLTLAFIVVLIEQIFAVIKPNDALLYIWVAAKAFFFYLLSVNAAKRIQDLNCNGYIAVAIYAVSYICSILSLKDLGSLVAWVSIAMNLCLIFKKGTIGINYYGPDPLENKN